MSITKSVKGSIHKVIDVELHVVSLDIREHTKDLAIICGEFVSIGSEMDCKVANEGCGFSGSLKSLDMSLFGSGSVKVTGSAESSGSGGGTLGSLS